MIFRSIFVFFSLLVASESSNYWSDDHGEPKKHVIEEVGSANNIRRTNISTEVRKKTFDHYRMLQVDIDTILDSFGQVQEYIDMILDSFGQVQEYIDTILDLISQGREGVIDFLTSVGIFEDDGEIDQVILFTSVTCLTVITSPIWGLLVFLLWPFAIYGLLFSYVIWKVGEFILPLFYPGMDYICDDGYTPLSEPPTYPEITPIPTIAPTLSPSTSISPSKVPTDAPQ